MSSTNAEASSSRRPPQLSLRSSAASEPSPIKSEPTSGTFGDNSSRVQSDRGSVRRTTRPRVAGSNRKIRTVPRKYDRLLF